MLNNHTTINCSYKWNRNKPRYYKDAFRFPGLQNISQGDVGCYTKFGPTIFESETFPDPVKDRVNRTGLYVLTYMVVRNRMFAYRNSQ